MTSLLPPARPDVSIPDWGRLRGLFPVTRSFAYFNVAANAPLPDPVVAAFEGYTRDLAACGSLHWRDWIETAARCRERAAALIGAGPDEIALVRNTSDGLLAVASGLGLGGGDSVVLVHGDFPANVHPWLRLREQGVEVRLVRPDERGRVAPEQLLAACDATTRLVTVSFVSFATGFRLDLDALAAMTSRRGILLCVDAIQGLGALPLDVSRCAIDFLAADGHKWLLGPEGTGIFYVRRERLDRLRPQWVSWLSMQDPFEAERYRGELLPDARRFEFASPNTAGVFALDAALALILEVGVSAIAPRVIDLTDRLADGLRARGCRVLSPRGDGEKSGIVSFLHPALAPKALNDRLLEAGVQCAVRSGAVRAAAHFYNDESDVARLLDALP